MKNKLTLIWMCILVLCASCENGKSTISEKDKFKIPEDAWTKKIGTWIMGYERYSSPNEVCRIIHCYRTQFYPLGEKTKPTPHIYPEYYGGILRLKKDNTKKVVFLTDTTKQTIDKFVQLCQITSDDISYQLCTYSLNELSQVTTQLRENIDSLTKTLGVSSIRYSVKDNRVFVYFLGNRDEHKIQRFKTEVLDSPMLIFRFKSDPRIQPIKSELEYVTDSRDIVIDENGEGQLVWTETHHHFPNN